MAPPDAGMPVTQQILVVEDDPFVGDLLGDVLRTAGYGVTTIDSTFGAASLVRECTRQRLCST